MNTSTDKIMAKVKEHYHAELEQKRIETERQRMIFEEMADLAPNDPKYLNWSTQEGYAGNPNAYILLKRDLRVSQRELDKRVNARKKSGKVTFDKTRKPIKDWCIRRAYNTRDKHTTYSKNHIVMELVCELDKQKWPKGVVPLSSNNAYNTIKKWLPKGKPQNWPTYAEFIAGTPASGL